MFSNDNLPEFCFKYYCKKCDYGTSKKSSYADHVLSAKHKKSMDCNEKLPKTCSDFVCKKCNKKSNTTQKIVFVMGGLMFGLSIYGLISLIIDIKSLF